MTDDKLRSELQAEYFYLQKVIEDFDSCAIAIKAWSITFSLTAIGGAFASKAHFVFLIASVSALMFWILEAVWKSFQTGYYQGSEAIERYFNGSGTLTAPFQIGDTWFQHWSAGGNRQWVKMMLWPHVALPHAVVVVIGGLLFAYSVLSQVGHSG